jgi:hypothetical protein
MQQVILQAGTRMNLEAPDRQAVVEQALVWGQFHK